MINDIFQFNAMLLPHDEKLSEEGLHVINVFFITFMVLTLFSRVAHRVAKVGIIDERDLIGRTRQLYVIQASTLKAFCDQEASVALGEIGCYFWVHCDRFDN